MASCSSSGFVTSSGSPLRDALGESELRLEDRLYVLQYERMESLMLFSEDERLLVLGAWLPAAPERLPP